MLFKYSILKLLLKTLSPEKLEEFSKSQNYNMQSAKLKPIKTSDNRGGRSLLCSGIELYNRYLLEWEGTSLPASKLIEGIEFWSHNYWLYTTDGEEVARFKTIAYLYHTKPGNVHHSSF